MRSLVEMAHPESLSASLGNVRAHGILVIGLFLSAAVYWGSVVPLDHVVSARGYVMAGGPVVPIRSAQDGRVETVLIDKGDRVAAGQMLIQMDTTRQRLRLDHARRMRVQLSLERLQVQALLARAPDVLIEPDLVSEIDALGMTAFLDDMKRTVRLAAAQHVSEAPQSGLAERMAALNASILAQDQVIANARLDIRMASLKSPVDGFVQDIRISSPGIAVSRQDVLTTIVPVDDATEVAVDLAAEVTDKVRPGAIGEVTAWLTPDMPTKAIPARVVRIPEIPAAPGHRQTQTILTLDPDALASALRDLPDPVALQPGLLVDVRIQIPSQTLFEYLASPLRKLTQRAFRD